MYSVWSPITLVVVVFRLTCCVFKCSHPLLNHQHCYIIKVQSWFRLCGRRSQKSAQRCSEVSGEASKFKSVSCQHGELVSALRLLGSGVSVVHASLLASSPRSKAHWCNVVNTSIVSLFLHHCTFCFVLVVRACADCFAFHSPQKKLYVNTTWLLTQRQIITVTDRD